jgi:hypothetical protein
LTLVIGTGFPRPLEYLCLQNAALSYTISTFERIYKFKRGYIYMRLHKTLLAFSFATILIGLPGCSAQNSSKTTRTEVQYEQDASIDDSRARYSEPQDKTVTEHSESTSSVEHSQGLFGVLGDIIALPFKALSAIF